MAKEVFENNYKDFICNTKDTVDVTMATDDDKQLKAHNIIYKSVSFQLTFKIAKETIVRNEWLSQ